MIRKVQISERDMQCVRFTVQGHVAIAPARQGVSTREEEGRKKGFTCFPEEIIKSCQKSGFWG